jgi:hypothetical protein
LIKLQIVAAAVAWTGLATTALNRFAETSGLGKMSSASVRHIGDRTAMGGVVRGL